MYFNIICEPSLSRRNMKEKSEWNKNMVNITKLYEWWMIFSFWMSFQYIFNVL